MIYNNALIHMKEIDPLGPLLKREATDTITDSGFKAEDVESPVKTAKALSTQSSKGQARI